MSLNINLDANVIFKSIKIQKIIFKVYNYMNKIVPK